MFFRRNKFLATVLLAFTVLGFTRLSMAQSVTFEASVDSNKISIGQAMMLTLTVNNAKSSQPIPPPAIDGFDVQYLGPSTRVSIVNGQYSSSAAYNYTLFPQKTGKFTIPAITVEIEGKTFTSQPIQVEVVDANVPLPSQQPSADESVPAQSLQDKIFLTMDVAKSELYEGERVPLIIKLFVHGVSARDIQFPEFAHVGFSVDPFDKQPRQYEQIVGGVSYNVIEFNTTIYPTRSGQLTLGPANLSCSLLYRSGRSRSSPFGSMDDFFNDDFFQGFFDQYQKRPINLKSVSTELNVLPLPQEGKPNDFSGAVGHFEFNATAGPTNVKAGDPVTLRMTISGDGNLSDLKMPSYTDLPGFKIYDPQVKLENGQKILEQVVIPNSKSSKTIPAIHFSYFDPLKKEYASISQGPFALQVTPGDTAEPVKVVESGLKAEEKVPALPEQVGRDIIFIKEEPGAFQKAGRHLYQNTWFLLIVGLITLGWFGFIAIFNRAQKLKTDSVYARRYFAPKKAKKNLAQAQQYLSQNKQKEFYDCLFNALQDYFAEKCHMPLGNITAETIESVLKSHAVKPEVIEAIRVVFAECEMVRYASMTPDQDKMKDNFKRAQEIIDTIERSWS